MGETPRTSGKASLAGAGADLPTYLNCFPAYAAVEVVDGPDVPCGNLSGAHLLTLLVVIEGDEVEVEVEVA